MVLLRKISSVKNAVLSARSIRLHPVFQDAKVKMPALSPTMATGTIVKWSKKEGETIASGDVLCEVQTDKAVVAMETDEEGILAKILVPENTPDVPVGRLIALIVDDGKDWKNVEIPAEAKVDTAAAVSDTIKVDSSTQKEVITAKVKDIPGKNKIMGPAVRLLLRNYQIDVKSIGKGSHSRALLKNDVLTYIQEKHLLPRNIAESLSPTVIAAPKPLKAKTKSQVVERLTHFIDVQVSNDKKAKASDFISSKFYVPHAYNRICLCMDDVHHSMIRLKQTGVDVTYADVVLKACAVALREVPEVSVYFDGEKVQPSVPSDIAIYLENYSEKMLTPLIKNIDRLRVTQISDQFRAIQLCVNSSDFSKLSFGPATFGFCDASTDGVVEFATILKSPQSALLCLGQVTDQIGSVATLVYDNRAISDDIAAEFLSRLNDNISNCSRMLLGLSRQHYDVNSLAQ